MNEHAKFLREESDAAMADDCPVASNGLKRAAAEIERLTYRLGKCEEGSVIRTRINDKKVAEIERLQDWLNVKTESAKINERIRERLAAENERLQARVAGLEGVYKAAGNYEKFQSHAYAGLLFDAVKAANEQDKPPFYTGFPTMHPPATEQEGE